MMYLYLEDLTKGHTWVNENAQQKWHANIWSRCNSQQMAQASTLDAIWDLTISHYNTTISDQVQNVSKMCHINIKVCTITKIYGNIHLPRMLWDSTIISAQQYEARSKMSPQDAIIWSISITMLCRLKWP